VRLYARLCEASWLCPGVLRERLLAAALGGVVAPRLVADVFRGGRWIGFLREYVDGISLDRVLVELLESDRAEEAAMLARDAGRLLGLLHRRASCLKGLFRRPRRLPRLLAGLLARWAGFLWARGFVAESHALLRAARDALEWGTGRLVVPHGDAHLGQFVAVRDGGLIAVDFMGEPFRPAVWLFSLQPAERDVASLLRSLDYVTVFAGERRWGRVYRLLCRGVLEGYVEHTGFLDMDALRLWILERAGYEAFYEYAVGSGLEWIPVSALATASAAWDCGG